MDTSRKLLGSGLPHPYGKTTNAHASANVSLVAIDFTVFVRFVVI